MSRIKVVIILAVCVIFPAILAYAEGDYVYDAKGKRNPFIALVTSGGRILKLDKDESRGDLSLEGIIFDTQGRSCVMINTQVLSIGDSINGYRVLKIYKNEVSLIKDGQISTLMIKREDE